MIWHTWLRKQRTIDHDLEKTLPPLILHPFADAGGPDKLVESSRASLMLQGLLPTGERTAEELDRALLDGRYCEIRMLYYVGKDLVRWIDQCLEHIERHPELRDAGIRYQSFAAYLVQSHSADRASQAAQMGRGGLQVDFHPRAGAERGARRTCRSADCCPTNSSAIIIATPTRCSCAARARRSSPTSPTFGFEFEIFASGEYSPHARARVGRELSATRERLARRTMLKMELAEGVEPPTL